ncbi:hypothetical protein HUN39_18625 [Methylocystis sp. FS]|uniref:hypothetical protein n=1 Tax=Methylocystis silviterrae TaxID=2743612 RepID=UPI0015843F16|nr:hypothetical protein [Methylocystis silviterrae]NUJ82001.1 hypothetical protein [Methylocystis silviterrae]
MRAIEERATLRFVRDAGRAAIQTLVDLLHGVVMNEIILADADREGETMTARVIRYDREQRRLELAAPNTTAVFTLYGDGERFAGALGGRSFYWDAPRAEPAKKRVKR